jgi:uncharacterized membrane protein
MFETDATPDFSDFAIEDYEDGKIFAMLCYLPLCCCIGYIGIILAIVQKNNDFHCFHARQGLGLGIVVAVLNTLGMIGYFICTLTGSAILTLLYGIMFGAVNLALLGIGLYGIFLCTKPEYKAFPVVGEKLTEIFKFIKKEEQV